MFRAKETHPSFHTNASDLKASYATNFNPKNIKVVLPRKKFKPAKLGTQQLDVYNDPPAPRTFKPITISF
tara:strand:- start:1052 stop:1261 length:210 start_codon:yes stop_codon:yes gene_type:complete